MSKSNLARALEMSTRSLTNSCNETGFTVLVVAKVAFVANDWQS